MLKAEASRTARSKCSEPLIASPGFYSGVFTSTPSAFFCWQPACSRSAPLPTEAIERAGKLGSALSRNGPPCGKLFAALSGKAADMPRKPRFYLPVLPVHLTRRGISGRGGRADNKKARQTIIAWQGGSMDSPNRSYCAAILSIVSVALAGCGGGGGGGDAAAGNGSTTPPVQTSDITYTGSVQQATLDRHTGPRLLAGLVGGSDATARVTAASATPTLDSNALGSVRLSGVGSVIARVQNVAGGLVSESGPDDAPVVTIAAIDVDETEPCEGGAGYIRRQGRIGDDGVGHLTLEFVNCLSEGELVDGTLSATIAGFDFDQMAPTDMTVAMRAFRVSNPEGDDTVSGQVRLIADFASLSETQTGTVVVRNNVTSVTTKFENFTIVDQYQYRIGTGLYTETVVGRYYDSRYGYVDVSTGSVLWFSSGDGFPYFGGPLILEGRDGARLTATPGSEIFVDVDVDLDGDGFVEYAGQMQWTELGAESTGANTPPIANAGFDVEATSTFIQLSGSLTWDSDWDLLSYSWVLTSRPAGSSATLLHESTLTPSITLDVPGVYEVTLTVNDGRVSSTQSISITGPEHVVAPLFEPYQSIPIAIGTARAVAIGDVNGDMLDDVVVAVSGDSPQVLVYLQAANGSLLSPAAYGVGISGYSHYFVTSVAIADVNNDSRQDVVINHQNGIGILAQNSSGTLDPPIIYASNHASFSNSYLVAAGDFNADGRYDVASIDWGTQSMDVDVFLQNSGGTIDSPVSYLAPQNGYADLAVGDVTGDGRADIVVMSRSDYDALSVLVQQADGTFGSAVGYSFAPATSRNAIAIGDVNSDGRVDVVVSLGGNNDSSIAILHQTASGTLDAPILLPSYDIPGAIQIGDVNNDGRADVVVQHRGWSRIGIYRQQDDGTLEQEHLYPFDYNGSNDPQNFAIGDINGDGWNDVVAATLGNLSVVYNRGL